MWEQIQTLLDPSKTSWLPLVLIGAMAGWGALMKLSCKFTPVKNPKWPFAENPQLALELADSPDSISEILGDAGSEPGDGNRKAALRFQGFDLVFILLYVLFFTAAAVWCRGRTSAWIVVVPALLTAAVDLLEDWQIWRMLRGVNGSSAKLVGQAKWLFFFLTVGAVGSLFFFPNRWDGLAVTEAGLGVFVILIALGGIFAVVRSGFIGIMSAASLSGLGLLLAALTPLIANHPDSLVLAFEYAVVIRIQLLTGLILFALPFIAFFTGARTLLRGLFDLTPASLFAVTLASLALAGTVCQTAYITLHNAPRRFRGIGEFPLAINDLSSWLVVMLFLGLPAIVFSLYLSIKESKNAGKFLLAVAAGIALALGVARALGPIDSWLVDYVTRVLSGQRIGRFINQTDFLPGYIGTIPLGKDDPLWDHLATTVAFVVTTLLYFILGYYGYRQIGKKRTVPALCSLLMVIMMLCWMLSAGTFFFDYWRVPILLIVAAAGFLTAQSRRSDHFYNVVDRKDLNLADPVQTILAPGDDKVIVVAANGGGIQAGAWAAQVLYGLSEFCGPDFDRALRMISSVSGGSVGNACFVHWLANGKKGRAPNEAAAMSSLDEVAWGMAWPDFMRSLFPWFLHGLIGRGRALEKAWCNSSGCDHANGTCLDDPLSEWNAEVKTGELPAVIMNATIAETGERLLFGTTHLANSLLKGARVDAWDLLIVNDKPKEVAIATAARLSASFPYVTPAARADVLSPQPHVVDGGYYDNYGMATLVEWLDEALTGTNKKIKKVLVIQILGAPSDPDPAAKRQARQRGWFYQAYAPLQALAAVRNAGQAAHNELELKFLREKWTNLGIDISSITFEFGKPDPPLSWHLTSLEQQMIKDVWDHPGMLPYKEAVRQFLASEEVPKQMSVNTNDLMAK